MQPLDGGLIANATSFLAAKCFASAYKCSSKSNREVQPELQIDSASYSY